MVRVFVLAGTPGTGKKSIGAKLAERCGVLVLNLSSLAVERGLIAAYDQERNSYIINEEKVVDFIKNYVPGLTCDVVFKTHYPEVIPRDLVHAVFLLRTHPLVLEERLLKRGWSRRKVNENVMAEILGVVAYNAVEAFGAEKVFEFDSTSTNVEDIAERICGIIRGEISVEPGVKIDWLLQLPFDVVKRFEDYEGSSD
ncbi:MAG: adenylate kinase family protein [Desulfurococcaceae archaeon]|nr:adenylate kinase family protein [Desulfurococcaceae archaeon]